MAERKPFLLRIDREVLDALQRWADDDLRSLNGQIEFVLRRALQDARRTEPRNPGTPEPDVYDSSQSACGGGAWRVEGRSASRWS
jgi:hypothetical protein